MPRYISYANFTDYRPNCFIENDIQTKNGIKNSFDYRMFLIKNTERLIKEASEQFKDEKCVFCPVCQSAIDLKP